MGRFTRARFLDGPYSLIGTWLQERPCDKAVSATKWAPPDVAPTDVAPTFIQRELEIWWVTPCWAVVSRLFAS